jgi:hypothetical protein
MPNCHSVKRIHPRSDGRHYAYGNTDSDRNTASYIHAYFDSYRRRNAHADRAGYVYSDVDS